MKPKAPIPPKPQMSEEERKEQMTRAFLQKRASLAEGILFNLCQGMNIIPRDEEINLLVDRSVEMADHLMEKLYGAKPQEAETGTYWAEFRIDNATLDQMKALTAFIKSNNMHMTILKDEYGNSRKGH